MNIKCLFGHKWNGCKCEKCGTTSNDRHILREGTCIICGVEFFTPNEFKELSKFFTDEQLSGDVSLSQLQIQALCHIYSRLVNNNIGNTEKLLELSPIFHKLILLYDNANAEAKAIANLFYGNKGLSNSDKTIIISGGES